MRLWSIIAIPKSPFKLCGMGFTSSFLTVSPLAFALLFVFGCASSQPRKINPARPGDLSYRELMLKDFEQMQDVVRKHIRYAKQDFAAADEDPQAEPSAFRQLKKALLLIFSRPDSDNVVAKLVPEVRRELALYDAYYRIVYEVAKESLQAFDPSLGVNTLTLATYTFTLQNLMAEIRTEARENPELQKTLQMIADANLKVPQDVVRERKLSGMFLSESPSERATKILKEIQTSQK